MNDHTNHAIGEIFTVGTTPPKRGGTRQTKHSQISALGVGQGYKVAQKDIGAVRSVIRSRKAANPILNFSTRDLGDGVFLIKRELDEVPAAPSADTPAS